MEIRKRIKADRKLLRKVLRSRDQCKIIQRYAAFEIRYHMTGGRVGGEGRKEAETEREPVGT